MNAAQNRIDPVRDGERLLRTVGEDYDPEEAAANETRGRPRKKDPQTESKRARSQRILLHMPKEYAHYLRGCEKDPEWYGMSAGQIARCLVIEALRARDVSPNQLRREYAEWVSAEIMKATELNEEGEQAE